ncbi:MAG TPA: hypothetical protein VK528_06065 [Flavobacterium sp.]|nr:hypothetical protein [Flavobacterium sp.]
MEDLLDHIHVFKTNIQKENLRQLEKKFGKNRSISQWNVDTEDCDLVLRVVSYDLSEAEIIDLVSQYGFECEELI